MPANKRRTILRNKKEKELQVIVTEESSAHFTNYSCEACVLAPFLLLLKLLCIMFVLCFQLYLV